MQTKNDIRSCRNFHDEIHDTVCHDWHAVMSITLGELIEGGLFDWEYDETLKFDYYDEKQYTRFCTKFVNHYYYRELGIVPYKEWKHAYMRRLNEIMPKYKILYKALDEGTDPLSVSLNYGKSRDMYNNFPQTQLGDNQDYADTGTDREHEDIIQGDFIDKTKEIKNKYDDIDLMIIEDLEPLFSQLFSVSMNGF